MAIEPHSKIEEQAAVKKYLASLTEYKVNPLWTVMQAAVRSPPNILKVSTDARFEPGSSPAESQSSPLYLAIREAAAETP
jgi:hypothetical protein